MTCSDLVSEDIVALLLHTSRLTPPSLVIQGQVDADAKGKLTQTEISKTVEFCFKAFAHVSFEEKEALVKKLKDLGLDGDAYDEKNRQALDELEKKLTPEERSILQTLKGRRMVRPEDSLNIDNFTLDSIDGFAPRLERGKLGLAAAKKAKVDFTRHDPLSYLNGESKTAKKAAQNGHAETNGHGSAATNGDKPVNGHSKAEERPLSDLVADLAATEKSLKPASLDEASRHRLIASLQESAEELETPYDTMLRFVNSVSAICHTVSRWSVTNSSSQTGQTDCSHQNRWRSRYLQVPFREQDAAQLSRAGQAHHGRSNAGQPHHALLGCQSPCRGDRAGPVRC